MVTTIKPPASSSSSSHTPGSASNRLRNRVGMVQLIFAKSKVYVHPSSSAKDNIPGFLALVRPQGAEDQDILMAWIPEPVINAEDYSSYVKVDLDPESGSTATMNEVYVSPPSTSLSSYAFSVPLRNIYSIQVRPPSLGWWWGSVIVHTKTEETLPALFSTTLNQKAPFKSKSSTIRNLILSTTTEYWVIFWEIYFGVEPNF